MQAMETRSAKPFGHAGRRALVALACAAALMLGAADVARAQVSLRSGFGGPAGYGTGIGYNDDGSFGPVDITPAFPDGLAFYGSLYNQMWVNNNGNVTFAGAVSTYTPSPFPVSPNPMIAAFWGDVDTRPGELAAEGAGSDQTYYHVDAAGGRVIATYYTVGYFENHTDLLNSFQIILTNRDDIAMGDFDIEMRYNRCEWTTGDWSMPPYTPEDIEAQMGYDAGDFTNY